MQLHHTVHSNSLVRFIHCSSQQYSMRLLPILFYYSSLCTLFHLPRLINSQCRCEKGWNVGLGLGTQRVCYLFTNETSNVTWTQSKSYCNKKHNATLPMPKDINMAHHLHNISYNQYLKHLWKFPTYALGLQFNSRLFNFSDARSQNLAKAWIWGDGTPLSALGLDGYPWFHGNPYVSYPGKVFTHAYAKIESTFEKVWFTAEENYTWNLINVCQRKCSNLGTNPSSSTVPASSITSSTESSNQSAASIWFIIVSAVLFLITLLVISILLGYRSGKSKANKELMEARKAKKSMLRQNGNFELMSSTGNPELDAIKTLDLFGGSSASHNPPSIVPLPDHDAESCPSLSYRTNPEVVNIERKCDEIQCSPIVNNVSIVPHC